MYLSMLRRQTGLLKAPVVVELIKAELESFAKIIVFGQYLSNDCHHGGRPRLNRGSNQRRNATGRAAALDRPVPKSNP